MNYEELQQTIREFYAFIRNENLSWRKFILTGGSALVLYGIVDETEDVDLIVPSSSEFDKLSSIITPVETYETLIKFIRKNVSFQAGLPREFGLVRPYNAYTILEVNGEEVPVRPKRFILKDYKKIIKGYHEVAEEVDDREWLKHSEPYLKYSSRLAKILQEER